MRYVKARYEEYNREEAYRFFITESLRLAPQGQYIQKSFYDIINNPQPADTRTGDEIFADVMAQAGLRFEEVDTDGRI